MWMRRKAATARRARQTQGCERKEKSLCNSLTKTKKCPCFPLAIMECPPFGPERCQIDPNQTVTLLVHRAHLVLVDRKKRVFVLPDKSLPTMTLKEGTSFLRFPTIMVNKLSKSQM